MALVQNVCFLMRMMLRYRRIGPGTENAFVRCPLICLFQASNLVSACLYSKTVREYSKDLTDSVNIKPSQIERSD